MLNLDLLCETRRADLLREASRDRLAQEVSAERPSPRGIVSRIVAACSRGPAVRVQDVAGRRLGA